VENVANYDAVLGNRISGLTLEDARTQLQALRELVDNTDPALPLHLIPRLFRGDKTGLRAGRHLEAFAGRVVRYHDLTSIVVQAIRTEEAVTPSQHSALRGLERVADQLGVTLGTPTEIRELGNRLQAAGITSSEKICICSSISLARKPPSSNQPRKQKALDPHYAQRLADPGRRTL
jgi:hypothetical protein